MCVFLLRSRPVTPQVPENLFSMSLGTIKVPMLTQCCEVSMDSPQFAKNSGTGAWRGDSQASRQLQDIQENPLVQAISLVEESNSAGTLVDGSPRTRSEVRTMYKNWKENLRFHMKEPIRFRQEYFSACH